MWGFYSDTRKAEMVAVKAFSDCVTIELTCDLFSLVSSFSNFGRFVFDLIMLSHCQISIFICSFSNTRHV